MPELPENPAGETKTSIEAAGAGAGDWNDLQIGFSGNPKAKLDDRGRLKMPAEFKSFIEKKYGSACNVFYITSREGKDAEIYPELEWKRHMAKVFQMPVSHPVRIKLQESYALYSDRVEMDPQGRLLFPEELRNEGFVNLEVKVTGDNTRLKVKSLTGLRQSVKSNPYTAQDAEVMNEFDV
ncbi:MAG: division/cell wall cluster transcriptional repressor MraZ [Terracidiphilus sp.]|jgi:MraZ protein